MSGIGALLNPRDSGNRLLSEANKRAAHLGPGLRRDLGLVPGEGAGRGGWAWREGAGLLLTGVVQGDPVCTPLPLWALYLLPPPRGEESVDGEEGAWPGLAALDPAEEVSGLCEFVSGPVGGRGEAAGLLRLEAAP